MGKSTISTGPFSISQTVTVNDQSKFMAWKVAGNSWRLGACPGPLGLPEPAPQRGRKWGVQLVGTCGVHLLQHLGASADCHGAMASWNPRKNLTTRPSKNGQNLCLMGSFPTNPIKFLRSGDVFFRPWLIRSKEKLGTALSDVAVKREWAPRLFQGERLKRLWATEGGWWWWLERLGMYGLEVSNPWYPEIITF